MCDCLIDVSMLTVYFEKKVRVSRLRNEINYFLFIKYLNID